MSVELFREDAYRRECEAVLVAIDEKGIRLDRTVFYPRSGGQAGDAGELVFGDRPPFPFGNGGLSPVSLFHTATHLLCAIVPHQTNGCSITRDYARLDFDMVEPLEREHLERELARLVAEAHAVRTVWVTDEELEAKPELVRTMSVAPPKGFGRVRLLEIEGVDLQACGGTHVANTREIGAIRVAKIEKKSARSRRVVIEFAS